MYNEVVRGNDMTQREIAIRELKAAGYELDRHGGKHDMYRNKALRASISLKRGDFDEGDLRYIRKEIKAKANGER